MDVLSVVSDDSEPTPETGNSGFGPPRRRSASERRSAPPQDSLRCRVPKPSPAAPPQESEVAPPDEAPIEGGDDASPGGDSFPEGDGRSTAADRGSTIVGERSAPPRTEVQEQEITH
eukprot:6275966-Pyramimonas_sp.AAC.1